MGTTSLTPKSAYGEETRVAGFGLSKIFRVTRAIRGRETPEALHPSKQETPNIRNFSTGHKGLLGQLLLDKKRITPRWAGD